MHMRTYTYKFVNTFPTRKYIYTYIYTCAHTYSHTYLHKYTYIFMKTRVHALINVCMRIFTYKLVYTRLNTCAHAYIQAHMRKYTYIHVQACTHTYTCVDAHVNANVRIQAHIRTYTYMYTYPSPVCPSIPDPRLFSGSTSHGRFTLVQKYCES